MYAGDEQGFRGVKYERANGDAEIRPEFPASPEKLAPDGWAIFRLHQDLIGLRRRHPWLARSATKVLTLQNETFGYLATSPDGDSRLAVLLNLSDDKSIFPLGDAAAGATVTHLLGSGDAAGAVAGSWSRTAGPSWNFGRDLRRGVPAVTGPLPFRTVRP